MATTPDTEALLARVDALSRELEAVQQQIADDHRLVTLGTLSAGLAHEVNNLLTPILGYASLGLQQAGDPVAVTRSLTRTRDAAERAAEVCQAILGLARAPSPQPVPTDSAAADSPPHANLRNTAEQALTATFCFASASRHTLTNDLPDRDVAIAPSALLQVLLNLLINAQQAMDRQGGQPGRVRLWADSDDRHATVHIHDTGPGIPPDQQATIFDAFCTNKFHTNSGLGLWISKRLIESAGGGIAVTSDPDSGTTFTLTLPYPAAGVRRLTPDTPANRPVRQSA